jgi:MFS family permease
VADLFGRRRVFITSICIFTLGSLLCGIATSMPLLVGFRGLQGIGAGGVQTCALIVMGDMFPPRERARWQVINSIGFATASAVGPTIGGLLSDNFSWRWIFLINVPVCIATVAMLLYGLADTHRPTRRPQIDWAGGVLSMVVVLAVLLALTWGYPEYGWVSPELIGLVIAAALSGVLLYRVERAVPEPVIPARLLRGNTACLSCVAAFGNSLVWFSVLLLVPLRLQLVLGFSATVSGALLTPGIIFGTSCSFVAGQLMSRTGRYRLSSLIAGVLQVIGVGLLLFGPPLSPELYVTMAFLVVSAGTSFGGPTFMIIYQNSIPRRHLGAGIGLLSLFRQFGASVGTALAGTIVGAGTLSGGPEAVAPAVQHAFVLPFAASVMILVVAWLTNNLPLRSGAHDVEDHGSSPPTPVATLEPV